MKKGFLVLMAMLLCLMLLAGCGAKAESTPSEGDLLAQIRERGTIVVAMEGTWSPWTYHDENDQLVGYDVEVAKAIADKLGVEAEFVEGEWDGLLAGLSAGRYDMMANGVNVTDERREAYDFTDPYAFDHTAVLTLAENDTIHEMADLNGKKTANTISSIYAQLAEDNGAEVTGVDDLNATIELLLSGRIDATLNSQLTYLDYMKAHPDAGIKVAVLADTSDPIAIPLRKSEETATLRAAINQALEELSADGTLSALSLQYFGVDIASEG